MTTCYFTNVNRYTRAGKNGKQILCPECREWSTVYHFSWSALRCIHCEEDINKEDFIIEASVWKGDRLKCRYSERDGTSCAVQPRNTQVPDSHRFFTLFDYVNSTKWSPFRKHLWRSNDRIDWYWNSCKIHGRDDKLWSYSQVLGLHKLTINSFTIFLLCLHLN